MKAPDPERNRKIVAFVEAYDWSYQLVADKFGVTRNVVAGLMFRHRCPAKDRVPSPNCFAKNREGNGGNKSGSGYRHRTYYPTFTATNSAVETGR